MQSPRLMRNTLMIISLPVLATTALLWLNGRDTAVNGGSDPTVEKARPQLRIVDDEPDPQVPNNPTRMLGLWSDHQSLANALILLTEDPAEKPAANKPAMADAFKPFANDLKLRWDDQYLYVGSNGMPNHEMMVGITAWQQQVPLPQSYFGKNAWQIPLHPTPADKPIPIKGHFLRGAIALAVNGVPIFNPQNNRGAISADIGELDEHGGHCGRGDDYHYHVAPLFLEKTVGAGKPIAYALDGYPIYGLTGPDGKPVDEKTLDAYHGKADADGNYAYYASKKYPFVFGAFHGKVTEAQGQVDPQPSAQPIRPAGKPLRGAKITAFSSPKKDHFTLKYEYDEQTCTINYSIEADGTYHFEFIDGQGTKTEEVYRRGQQRPSRQDNGAPPPR